MYVCIRSGAFLGNGDVDRALKDAEQCILLSSGWAKGERGCPFNTGC